MIRSCLFLIIGMTLAACGREAATPVFHGDDNPALLSEWGVVTSTGAELVVSEGVTPYDLNTSLFTDHAGKLRTIWMPQGASANYSDTDVFDFPVGTIISKTFYYVRGDDGSLMRGDEGQSVYSGSGGLDLTRARMIETRLLVRRADGWAALPYVWNDDQTEARLMRTGDLQQLTVTSLSGDSDAINYFVPNVNQCAGCHATNNTTRAIQPIGPAARHLNRDYNYPDGSQNQFEHLIAAGYLTGAPQSADAPQAAVWTDLNAPIGDRARAWLDINCAHCHNPVGPADTSGLLLDPGTEWGPSFGLCKTPIAAGPGSGGHRYDIVPGNPDESILIYRMESLRADEMMPELGRSIVHDDGVALIREWIETLDGDCDA